MCICLLQITTSVGEYRVIIQCVLLDTPQKTKFKVFAKRKQSKAESTRQRFVYALFWGIDFHLKYIESRAKQLN